MKYRIDRQPWPIGGILIEPGTVIDTASNDQWSQIARGKVPPPNAVALDQETFDALRKAYPYHQLFAGPGVRR